MRNHISQKYNALFKKICIPSIKRNFEANRKDSIQLEIVLGQNEDFILKTEEILYLEAISGILALEKQIYTEMKNGSRN